MTETILNFFWDAGTPLPGEKLFDPSRYGPEEYFILTLAVFIVFVAIKHLIFHTGYFWWYRQGQFYIPNTIWSLVSGKSLPQRVVNHVKDNVKTADNSLVSVNAILDLIDEFCTKKEFTPTLGKTKGKILEDAVKRCGSYPDFTALVVGCHVGYPLLKIVDAISSSDKAKVIVIEEDLDFICAAQTFLTMTGKEKLVTFLSGSDDADILDSIKTSYGQDKFDFVFLNRTKLDQPSHIRFFKSLESAGLFRNDDNRKTLILADKVITPGDAEYLKYVRLSPNYETEYYQMALEHCDDEIYDGMELATFTKSN